MQHPGSAVRLKLLSNTLPLMSRVADNHRDWSYRRRLCLFCCNNQPEDTVHFVSHCSFYADLRDDCKRRLQDISRQARSGAAKMLVNTSNDGLDLFTRQVLDDRSFLHLNEESKRKWQATILNYLKLTFRRRDAVWRRMCLPGKPWQYNENWALASDESFA